MKIEKYGFEKVGKWMKNGKLESKINFSLNKYENERVIYIFKAKGQVKYIGICEGGNTTLSKRMKRYQSQAGGGTNKRIFGEIKSLVDKNINVYIFAKLPKLIHRYKDIEIDLVKGLENPLINKYNPNWNLKK